MTHAYRLITAWADSLCSAIMLMTTHARCVGTYDEDVAEAVNHAADELLCAFERLPEVTGHE